MAESQNLDLMNQEQLARQFNKSVAWVERSRWNGSGPKFIKIGRSVWYRREDILDWLGTRARASTHGDR